MPCSSCIRPARGAAAIAEPFADQDHHAAVGLQFTKPQRELAQGGGHDLRARTRNGGRGPADVLLFEAAPSGQVALPAGERGERGVECGAIAREPHAVQRLERPQYDGKILGLQLLVDEARDTASRARSAFSPG